MPKRIGNIASKIYDIHNVAIADQFARLGKENKYGVIKHDKHRKEEDIAIAESLKNDNFKVSNYKISTIYEPKKRILKKLPYAPDRIIQWAIMIHLVPIWDKVFIKNTYSCIRGRGLHLCKNDVYNALKNNPEDTIYCLKFDIKKFYDSVRNSILKIIIQKKIKDKLVLSWLDKIIDSCDGIPIGNYTSQYFANLYLSYFDHYCKELLRIKYYFRYADDIVILSSNKKQLWKWYNYIKNYLNYNLELEIKYNYQVFPVDKRGIDFVGYKIYRTHILLRKSIKLKMKELCNNYCKGLIDKEHFIASMASYVGWCKHCNSRNLLNKLEKQTGIHFTIWDGKLTNISNFYYKYVRIYDVIPRKKYFILHLLYKHNSYKCKSKSKYLWNYLQNFSLPADIVIEHNTINYINYININ